MEKGEEVRSAVVAAVSAALAAGAGGVDVRGERGAPVAKKRKGLMALLENDSGSSSGSDDEG